MSYNSKISITTICSLDRCNIVNYDSCKYFAKFYVYVIDLVKALAKLAAINIQVSAQDNFTVNIAIFHPYP